MDWLSSIRPLLESLYFIASIGLFATVIIGLKQLKLLKKDIADRNKRAAVEKSIEYLNLFATEFIPHFDDYRVKLTRDGVILHQGPYEDFIFTSEFNAHVSSVKTYLDKSFEHDGNNLANELEFFAAALLSGLADEELVFNPVAEIYCESIEHLYVIYCDTRKDSDSRLFTHTIKLYKMWKARLNKLQEERNSKLRKASSTVGDQRIRSIGG